MRNLPQTVERFQSNEQEQEDCSSLDDQSIFNTVCPLEWPMNEKKPRPSYRGTRRSFSERRRSSSHHNNQNTSETKRKLYQFCNYLVEHRTRLLLTFISLVFLSLFLVVIYRQFGWITFASILGIIAIPFVLIFIYSRRLEYKDEEQQQQQQQQNKKMVIHQHQHRSSTKTSPSKHRIFHTELEMKNLKNENRKHSLKKSKQEKEQEQETQQHKQKQQKIIIKIPPKNIIIEEASPEK